MYAEIINIVFNDLRNETTCTFKTNGKFKECSNCGWMIVKNWFKNLVKEWPYCPHCSAKIIQERGKDNG